MHNKIRVWCLFNIYLPIAAYILKVPKTRKIKGNFWKTKIYGVLLTFSPAAADTILNFLKDTGTEPQDYDYIFTGDLGFVGSELLLELMERQGVRLHNHRDCGKLMFDKEKQDVHSGGSGCGCVGSLFCSYILSNLQSGKWKKVLVVGTGALLSTVSTGQGESIPCIAHLVELERND